jgi:L-ascorbate metabolism protein UlaG (beta-lactamase superfamily)
MVQITWLGHGTFSLRLETGEVYVVDPWIEGNPKFPTGYEFDRVDGILLTHGHYDHIGGVAALTSKFNPKVVAIYEVAHYLSGQGVKNVMGMNKGGTAVVGPLRATMTHAIHSSGIIGEDGKMIYAGEAAGFVLRFPDGRNAYFAGDTTVFSDMALIQQLYEPELAFLPIGDLFTMSPHEARLACELVKAKTVIPMHFGTFPALTGTPDQLAELTRGLAEVWKLEPGVAKNW